MSLKELIITAVVIGVILYFIKTSRLTTMKIGKNFYLADFTRTSTGLENVPNDVERANLAALVVNVLDPIAEMFGVTPVVSSGFRSDAVNAKVGGAETSQHRKGQASDITVPGVNTMGAYTRIVASKIPYDQIIYEVKEGKTWIHISYGPAKRKQALTAAYDPQAKKYTYKTFA